MIIMAFPRSGASNGHVIGVFGAGLIGGAIADALMQGHRAEVSVMPLHWSEPLRRNGEIKAIEARIGELIRPQSKVGLVWSAGRAGFLSSTTEIEAELLIFRDVMAMAERMTQRYPEAHISFHLVSSAGGLFEGQRRVTATASPEPRRRYGVLKMTQEQLVTASERLTAYQVYRLASVYGYLRRGARAGLVSQLISDGLLRSVTHMIGKMSTLRDFVFAGDAGVYIADKLLAPDEQPSKVSFLVRMRPSSLLEVQHMVEDVIGRKLHVAYSLDSTNSADITFASDAAPSDWHPSDLRSNIGMIYRAALSSNWIWNPAATNSTAMADRGRH